MAGFKRGGFRGGGGGTFKGYAKKRSEPDDGDSAPRSSKKAKGDDEEESVAVVPKLEIDDDGNQFIGLNASGKRRVTVSEYNKKTLVNIREYWVSDSGELKPGKKGISLTVDQYNTLLAAAPLLESILAQKDIEVVRPAYDADTSAKPETPKADGEDDEESGVRKEESEEQVQKVDDDDDDEEE
ncbi:PC4-domain-containing protein [Cucurbitaria berberidis CBS 394.84]|uniref:PC4-domain-containing protein n=1 Tax=Cucurbitaria berberidis CBS 394.84 TaxID=1168544 RepID=A0A9P4GNX7_9PLEO|nr:PC4-domain-containing protein [Cucurbitaria berberidis CBS 394.84]KAF1848652.1 PC4-domain-containing protein [Cucurbitaria berberidis CBS 394.84]